LQEKSVSDKKTSSSRLAKSEKAESAYQLADEHFHEERNEEIGVFLLTLTKSNKDFLDSFFK